MHYFATLVLVIGIPARLHCAIRFWCIRHPARLRGELLLLGAISLALLLTAHRSTASLVATAALTRTLDSRRSLGFPCYLLLLPQSLLPRIFPGPSCLFRR